MVRGREKACSELSTKVERALEHGSHLANPSYERTLAARGNGVSRSQGLEAEANKFKWELGRCH